MLVHFKKFLLYSRSKGVSGIKNPSEIASGWQGDDIYTGIDEWGDVSLKQGDTFYRGEPSGTDFFTNKQSIDNAGSEASTLFEGLQVQEHPTFGYRSEMQGYTLKTDLSAAEAKCLANSQFGKGGLDQLFIPDANELIEKGILIPTEKIKLK